MKLGKRILKDKNNDIVSNRESGHLFSIDLTNYNLQSCISAHYVVCYVVYLFDEP